MMKSLTTSSGAASPYGTWFVPTLVAFFVAAAAGIGLLGFRQTLRGSADPFSDGWPGFLQVGSLVLTLLVAWLSRRPFTTAFGLYSGLIAYMIVDGGAEYPVASIIALAIHGLCPALIAATSVVLLRRAFIDKEESRLP